METRSPATAESEGAEPESGPALAETNALPIPEEPSVETVPESSVSPGINNDYVEATSAKRFVERLERHGREVHDRKETILHELAPEPGMQVADIGAGTGLFTLDLARAVGAKGKVYAVELAPALLEHVATKAKKAGLGNVVTVLADERDARLPPASIDLALMSDVYHHIEFPRTYMKSVLQGLRPGGVLFVVDFKRIEGTSESWLLEHVRADEPTVRREIEDAGFELVRSHEPREPLDEHYILEFRRPTRGQVTLPPYLQLKRWGWTAPQELPQPAETAEFGAIL